MEIQRPSRTCSVSQRDFLPNESFFSVLVGEEGQFVRKDIAAEHWTGPPEEFLGWWKSTAKHIATATSQRQASVESLQTQFEQLLLQPEEADTLYILTLLMLRRKMLRYEKETADEQGNRWLEVYALNSHTTYQIQAAMPNHERLQEIQQKLSE